MKTEQSLQLSRIDLSSASRFVALPAVVTITVSLLLFVRGFSPMGAILALLLPAGALMLIFVILREGSYRSSVGAVTVQGNPRRYWLTIGLLAGVYAVGTAALIALLLRSN